MRADTIPGRLVQQDRIRPNAPAYYVKQDGAWLPTTWKGYVAEVRRAAKALMALGLEPGEKVAMLGFNRPEWAIFCLGAMAAGGVGAGIYTTCSAEEVSYVVQHAEAVAILLEDESQWAKIDAERNNLPQLRHVIMMKGASHIDDPLVISWEEFNANSTRIADSELEARLDALSPDALATLIYTSGTTGPSKGVMLSHENLAWTASRTVDFIDMDDSDCVLSYLPLSHIAEQMISIHLPASLGTAVYYAEAITKVADNLREVQPTTIFGVPRIWEKMHDAVSTRLAETTGLKQALVSWARRTASEVNALRNQGRTPGLPLLLQHRLADRLVLSKIKQALGLSRAKMCACGAAPITREILEFFASLDVVIHEIYGQSEDCGPTTFNRIGKTRFGTAGSSIPGIEVKIAEDGEILIRGKNVFMGYYKDEEATRAALMDGWLHSGDLGHFDDEGFLTITGRKKDIIITSGGKNIAPTPIEVALKQERLISEAVVIGDRRKYLTALITLDEEVVSQFIQERGLAPAPVDEIPALRAAVQDMVNEVNRHLAQVETIKKFHILRDNFTIAQGDLTPTLKVKRAAIAERFKAQIDAMYTD